MKKSWKNNVERTKDKTNVYPHMQKQETIQRMKRKIHRFPLNSERKILYRLKLWYYFA